MKQVEVEMPFEAATVDIVPPPRVISRPGIRPVMRPQISTKGDFSKGPEPMLRAETVVRATPSVPCQGTETRTLSRSEPSRGKAASRVRKTSKG